jgi:hypothetical protein
MHNPEKALIAHRVRLEDKQYKLHLQLVEVVSAIAKIDKALAALQETDE